MSQQQCAVKDCKRASRTLCQCCNQNLCREHFNQHDDFLNSQLNPLTDEINSLSDRLSAIRIDRITSDSRKKLDRWRLDCHQIIDRCYEQKCAELEYLVRGSIDEQRQEIAKISSKVTKLIDKQETTKTDIESLTKTIRNLEQKMNQIENTSYEVEIHPLFMNHDLIQLKRQSKEFELKLSNIVRPFQIEECPNDSCFELASNDRSLMVCMSSNLYLINGDLKVIKQTKLDRNSIEDLCWSSILEQFIIITKEDIFLLDQNTMSFERVEQIKGENWWVGGCSNTSLYLSQKAWDSSILEYNLLPSIQLKARKKTNDITKHEERVDSIIYNKGTLALTINNRSNQTKRIDLRSSETFSLFWSTQLTIIYDTRILRCCSVTHNEWLLADWPALRMFHITADGKPKETHSYTFTPYNINLFLSDILAIGTNQGVQFHRLSSV